MKLHNCDTYAIQRCFDVLLGEDGALSPLLQIGVGLRATMLDVSRWKNSVGVARRSLTRFRRSSSSRAEHILKTC